MPLKQGKQHQLAWKYVGNCSAAHRSWLYTNLSCGWGRSIFLNAFYTSCLPFCKGELWFSLFACTCTSSPFLVPATGNYFFLLLFCNLVKKCLYSFTDSFSKQQPARTLRGSDFHSTLSVSPELFCCTSRCRGFLRRIESKWLQISCSVCTPVF